MEVNRDSAPVYEVQCNRMKNIEAVADRAKKHCERSPKHFTRARMLIEENVCDKACAAKIDESVADRVEYD